MSESGSDTFSGGALASRFRPDIEGLRGIAVLAVALWHAEIPGIPGGFTGVDVFFVLSGYLITGLLLAEFESTSRIGLANFYARRARRLIPAATVMLAVTLLVSVFVMAPRELFVAAGSGRAASVYLSNVWFAMANSNYFAQTGTDSPFVHTWSLALEEQFYLIWPILILFCLRLNKSRKSLAIVLGVLSALSFGACLLLSYKSPQASFYYLPTRAWEFGAGALASFIPIGYKGLSHRVRVFLGWAGLAGIAGCFFGLNHIFYPGWRGVLPVIATAVVLIGVPPSPLSFPPLQRLGRLSYSWYLWHWPILVLAAALVRPLTMSGRIAALAFAFALAAITHHFIENPIRFSRYLSARPIFSLAMAAGFTAFSFGIMSTARWFSYLLAQDGRLESISKARDNIARPASSCVPEDDSAQLLTCLAGDSKGRRHIVLFGDSHAMHWFPPIEKVAVAQSWKITPLVRPGCPSTDVRRDYSWREDLCIEWREKALAWIAATRPDLVVVTNIAPTGGVMGKHVQPRAVQMYRDGLRRTLVKLSGLDVPVLLIRDNPHQNFNIPSCLARAERTRLYSPAACKMNAPEALHPQFFEADKSAAAGLPNVYLVDFSREYCGSDYCDVQRDNLILYRDHQHFTRRYALTLAPLIKPEMDRILRRREGLHAR